MKPFKVERQDSRTRARAGILETSRGEIKTPVFMPVGTQATVKTLSTDELEAAGAQVILGNAYHLYLRPGVELIREAGGLHRFMGWTGPILTDSGGYQIFSLKEPKKISEEGLKFKSHWDGSSHFVTPESVIDIQLGLGSDIIMPLDVCVAYPEKKSKIEEAMRRTHAWAERSLKHARTLSPKGHLFFGIVQGGMYADLRKESAQWMAQAGFDGIAYGGLSVGEPQGEMMAMLEVAVKESPDSSARYLMGVGYPEDMVLAVERGVDMFDCVVPTRNGRNGTVFSWGGKLLLQNAEFARDFGPIDASCPCFTCRHHSRAYLRHLFQSKEMLGLRLASLHNITFFIQLLNQMRQAILEDRFLEFKETFLKAQRNSKKS